MTIQFNQTLDVKGADFQGWAKAAKNVDLVGQETVQNNGQDLYLHYVKRTA